MAVASGCFQLVMRFGWLFPNELVKIRERESQIAKLSDSGEFVKCFLYDIFEERFGDEK